MAQFASCGPSLERHLEAINRYVQVGYDHIIWVQVGPEQDAFIDFFERDLARALSPHKDAQQVLKVTPSVEVMMIRQ